MTEHASSTVHIQLPAFHPNHHYETVENAIEYLRNHITEQPSLTELAKHVGLSPNHLIEVFQQWAGITPKRLLKILTLDRAKQLLLSDCSNLETSLSCGLSGTGRLHDLFVTIEAMSPGEFKRSGLGLQMQWGLHKTPFGQALVVCTQRGLSHLYFPNEASPEQLLMQLKQTWNQAVIRKSQESTAPYIDQIFYGVNSSQPLRILLKGTSFQVKVWKALLEIPKGQTTAYSALANSIGKPSAHRACASAIGDNPISYLIPCHRVLRKNLALGGYRWGLARKTAMLATEIDPKLIH